MGGFKQIWKSVLTHPSYSGYKDPDNTIYYGVDSVTDIGKFCYRNHKNELSEDIPLILEDGLEGKECVIDILYGLYHLNEKIANIEEVTGEEYMEVRNYLEGR